MLAIGLATFALVSIWPRQRRDGLSLSPNLERPAAVVRTIAFVLLRPRVARSLGRQSTRPESSSGAVRRAIAFAWQPSRVQAGLRDAPAGAECGRRVRTACGTLQALATKPRPQPPSLRCWLRRDAGVAVAGGSLLGCRRRSRITKTAPSRGREPRAAARSASSGCAGDLSSVEGMGGLTGAVADNRSRWALGWRDEAWVRGTVRGSAGPGGA